MKKFLSGLRRYAILLILPCFLLVPVYARKIDEIIIHCSATPYMTDIGTKEIRAYHTGILGWQDIGYHYVIRLDGTVELGRKVDIPGAHCRGHNSLSIGIAYIGGIDSLGRYADTRTEAQRIAMSGLIEELRRRFGDIIIRGHRDHNPAKACPCFEITDL